MDVEFLVYVKEFKNELPELLINISVTLTLYYDLYHDNQSVERKVGKG